MVSSSVARAHKPGTSENALRGYRPPLVRAVQLIRKHALAIMANVAGSESKLGDDQANEMESAAGGLVASRGIDKERSRYPYCIVWTPLPLITWFLPPIGGWMSLVHVFVCLRFLTTNGDATAGAVARGGRSYPV